MCGSKTLSSSNSRRSERTAEQNIELDSKPAGATASGCTERLQTAPDEQGVAAIRADSHPIAKRKPIIPVLALVFAVGWIVWPAFPPPDHFETGLTPTALWWNRAWQQVSGYVLLALCVGSLGLSLRKRFDWFVTSPIPLWRMRHGILGTAAILIFALHTGCRTGSNLNFALAMVFLGLTTTGALAGIRSLVEHRAGHMSPTPARLILGAVHQVLFWTTTVLAAFHLLAVYYF